MIRWKSLCPHCHHTFEFRIDVPILLTMYHVEACRKEFGYHKHVCKKLTEYQLKNRIKELV